MCLILFAVDVDPRWPLVIAANRDEFYARATKGIHRWPDLPIIGGRDLAAGGTWMGVSVTSPQRVAAVTNVRVGEPTPMPGAVSRGTLPVDFLVGADTPRVAVERFVERAGDYAPVNLLVADGTDVWWATNRPEPIAREVTPGVHGLSNGILDSPWPKVTDGSRRFAALLERPDGDVDDYLSLLDDRRPAPLDRLPDTGIGTEREERLSPMFIDIAADDYGTRASTVLRIGRDAHGDLTERRFRHGRQETTATLVW
ncbi:NRDE family protein [Gordonia sp. NPDC003429]